MNIYEVINRSIKCTCGAEHRCDIEDIHIGKGVLEKLPQITGKYNNIMLISDTNTDPLCGHRVRELMGGKIAVCYILPDKLPVPCEATVNAAEASMPEGADFVLGIGSGVINDICKYISFRHGIPCGIIATATSMDGYASSGAAMIFDGMKVTFTTHAPSMILGDTDILKDAPMDMIRSGYADIIGKYSSMNDWKLAALINNEHFCPYIYKIVKDSTNEVRDLAPSLVRRDADAIGRLMEILVLVGVCLTLLGSTRPGSGSEHHLSHYFEITGLIEDKPYFFHGTDVGYSTVVTAALREKILKIKNPSFRTVADDLRKEEYKRIYRGRWQEVWDIQEQAGSYKKDLSQVYIAKWDEVCTILAECPTADKITDMLTAVGFEPGEFEKMYGIRKITDGIRWGKDLKDRYSVLWLYSVLDFEE